MAEPRKRIDLVGSRRIWYLLSLAVIVTGMFFVFQRWGTTGHPLNLGIDFTGGALTQFQFERAFGASMEERVKIIEEARRLAAQQGARARVEVEGDDILTVNVQLSEEKNVAFSAELKSGLEQHLGQRYGKAEVVAQDFVGPVVGAELKKKAIYALIIGMGLIILYLSYRYDFKFAICAIIALIHDVLVMVGAVALSGMMVNSEFVAALLTVVGYSVNDTVVIFDRIRENTRLRKMDPFDQVVNDSLLQTMARSVNTVLTVLIVLLFLFFMGGAPIHSFAFALLVGITSGAYSSIFNASQVLVSWKGREVSIRQRVAAARMAERMRLRGVPTSPTPAPEAAGQAEQGAAAARATQPAGQSALPSPVRKAGTKKKVGGKRRKRY